LDTGQESQDAPPRPLATVLATLPTLPALSHDVVQRTLDELATSLGLDEPATLDAVGVAAAWLGSLLLGDGASDPAACSTALRVLEILAQLPDTGPTLLPLVPTVLTVLSSSERVGGVVGAGLAFLGALSSQVTWRWGLFSLPRLTWSIQPCVLQSTLLVAVFSECSPMLRSC
jgi:hypothetical protein